MINRISIASMMVCVQPKYLNGRLILSVSDSVWNPVENLDEDLKVHFTDEIGNKTINYYGFLQMIDPNVLPKLTKLGFFSCFRGVTNKYLEYVKVCPPKSIYKSLLENLMLMGWDISSGNGWLSASCHGIFPIDPFTGFEINHHADLINKYGLFDRLKDCLMYCKINNFQLPEHAPWFPVAIYIDQESYLRLKEGVGIGVTH